MQPLPFDKHALVGTCLRLPLQVDTARLFAEIQSIPRELWGERRANVHDASAEAVFVKGYAPVHRKPDDERPVLGRLPYLRSVIYQLIPGTPGKCVVASVKPGSVVLMHRDGHMDDPSRGDRYFYDYFSTTLRIHIPVVTNDKAWIFCNGEFFHIPVGEVWTINNLSDHAAINDHPTSVRTHVIVDIHPNRETLELVGRSVRVPGRKDRAALTRLMQTSESPSVSPYARGKPLPY